ncbi:chromate transporter [Phenylobacterium sp. J367]|uniref:chromate transporter n=1 Tax=Phenylobacterium sp. J367 TaxID=2898435 RepID=UPI0027E2FAF4|nr:chromate transporter [Phenylobacterium sp. J367]
MSDGQFLDGLALSGVLPAPLIIFSTFVGYVAGGPLGAVAMTVGIFLPAFAFSLVLYDRLEAVLEVKALHALLEGVAAGVVGLIAATTLQLAQATAGRVPSLWPAAAIFAGAFGRPLFVEEQAQRCGDRSGGGSGGLDQLLAPSAVLLAAPPERVGGVGA